MKLRSLAAGLVAALLLAGCSTEGGFALKNPFEQPSLTESYVSQFRDVPIPAPMTSVTKESYVTVGHDGGKIGLESFEGRVEVTSLANVMMQNMARSGWQLRGSSAGMRSIQLYQKEPHYAVIFYSDGVFNAELLGKQLPEKKSEMLKAYKLALMGEKAIPFKDDMYLFDFSCYIFILQGDTFVVG